MSDNDLTTVMGVPPAGLLRMLTLFYMDLGPRKFVEWLASFQLSVSDTV